MHLYAVPFAGDEVLEWNGHTLQNVTPEVGIAHLARHASNCVLGAASCVNCPHFQTVYNIVQSTKADPRLELIVSRSLDAGGDDFLNARRIAREQQGAYRNACVSCGDAFQVPQPPPCRTRSH